VKLIQPQNYRKSNHLIERCEIQRTPFDVRVLQTFIQPHSAPKIIRMTSIQPTLSGARITISKGMDLCLE
jgi:hypothetical protein